MMRNVMIRMLLMLFLSPYALAAPNVLPSLSKQELPSPIKVMQQVELLQAGVISHIRLERSRQGQLNYRIGLIDSRENHITHYSYNIDDDLLINEGQDDLDPFEVEKLNAVLFLKVNRLSFSNMVNQATLASNGYLVNAELEHDLGVIYLSAVLVDAKGKHVIAYDIGNQKPMPVLKWH